MTPKRSTCRSLTEGHRRGAAAVELALVAPIFLMLLAGIIEFGQAFQLKHTLSNAARRGARTAVAPGTTSSEVTQIVKSHGSRMLGIQESDIDVVIALNGAANTEIGSAVNSDEIQVTVKVPYAKAGVGFFSHIFNQTTLHASCILERE